ncbi:MAG: hypothetical protein AMXMBFR84_38450 [Candidatus Hydrogenedentota bacterium]
MTTPLPISSYTRLFRRICLLSFHVCLPPLAISVAQSNGQPEGDHSVIFEGAVYMPDGSPASGAKITCINSQLHMVGGFTYDPPEYSETDADGFYFIQTQSEWGALVRAEKDGLCAITMHNARAVSTPANTQLVLQPVGYVAGRVMNDTGAPVQGATIKPYMNGLDQVGKAYEDLFATQTNAEGQFRIEGLPLGEWSLYVNAKGFELGLAENIPINTEGFQIGLKSIPTFRARIISADTGETVPGVELVASTPGIPRIQVVSTSDADGFVSFESLPAGEVTVMSNSDDYVLDDYNGKLTIPGGEKRTEPVELRVKKAGTIRGTLREYFSKKPIEGVRIGRRSHVRSAMVRPAFTGAEGTFELKGVPPGQCGVHTTNAVRGLLPLNTGYQYDNVSVTVESGKTVEGVELFLVGGVTIEGKVTDPSGNPVANAIVYGQAEPEPLAGNQPPGRNDPPHTLTPDWDDHVRTDGSGRYTLLGCPTGKRIFVQAISAKASTSARIPLEIERDGLHDVVLILSLPVTARITGRALDKDGKPVRAVIRYNMEIPDYDRETERVYDQTRLHFGMTVTTGQDGVYVLGGLPAGNLQIKTGLYKDFRSQPNGEGPSITVSEGTVVKNYDLEIAETN